MKEEKQGFVIGVDGGGTKTVAVLSNLEGKILKLVKTGSSHPRNLGFKKAVENLAQTIEKILPKNKRILSTFLGLPATEEEFKFKKEKIKREFLKYKKVSPIFRGKLTIGSDQLAGFRSGTDEKEGVVLIAGSGCVVHSWRGGKEAKVCGWGYLSEMGSAFFVGQKALQNLFKDLDGRGPKTLITKFVFQRLKVKTKENLIEKIYSENPAKIIPSFAILVDDASKKGDAIAKRILVEAGEELALSANTVIRKLNFQKIKFPLVLIGSMFNSEIILNTVKKEVKKIAPRVEFIRPKVDPAMGAAKLAIEKLK